MEYAESRMHAEAHRLTATPEVTTLLTPINILLFSIFLYISYRILFPAPKTVLPAAPPPIVFKTFDPPSLIPFSGNPSTENPHQFVYLAVRGRVFDVSSGRNFYGPGGPYENFAGRDASRGLACGSFDENMLTKDLEGPLDTLEGLGAEEMEALRGWEERFEEKYLVVGRLVSVEEKKRLDAGGEEKEEEVIVEG